MNYYKPILQIVSLNVDVASCKPSDRGCSSIFIGGLCFPSQPKIYVQGFGEVRDARAALPEAQAPPPIVDIQLVLP